MIPKNLLPLAGLAVAAGLLTQARAQGASGTPPEQAAPIPVVNGCLADLHDKFEKMKNPPLSMGDLGERVRELQFTLNSRLGGRPPIELRHPLLVGSAQGPGDSPRNKQRLVYSPHRDSVFQIRGDWEPLDEAGNKLKFDGVDHREASFLQLPEDPLKVDGIFGQHTQAAVALFQHQQSLSVSGELDAVTLDKLEPLIPNNPLLALIMSWVSRIFSEDLDSYPYLVKTFTSVLATIIILLAAAVVYQVAYSLAKSTHFLSRWLFTPESAPWFTALYENKVFRCAAQFAPAIFIWMAAMTIFPSPDDGDTVFPYLNTFQEWQVIVSRLGLAYLSLVLMLVGFAIANAVDSVTNPDRQTDNPIGSIIRASKRVIGFVGTVLIVASLAGRSPFLIVGGLGAFMAVFMLVFKDFVLGLVSSVQIIANKVVQIGDWISMPRFHADGSVQNISLTLIKVQNADKTISTIPTRSVLSESFQNWTPVEDSGGRRIKRSILIDMRKIKVCTQEMIERFGRIELLHGYLEHKMSELDEYNREHQVKASAVNSRRLTNIGTFRAYLDAYLKHHPGLNPEMTILVRHLQSTSSGLPIEIYAFCSTTEWAKYEAVQADIFDHLLAILPEFELRTFQEPTDGGPTVPSTAFSWHWRQAGLAEIESLVEAGNRELEDHPRTRAASRLKIVRQRIAELALEEHLAVRASGRKIVIDHI